MLFSYSWGCYVCLCYTQWSWGCSVFQLYRDYLVKRPQKLRRASPRDEGHWGKRERALCSGLHIWGTALPPSDNLFFPLTGPAGSERAPAACFWVPGHQNQGVLMSETPTHALGKKRNKENREVSVTSFWFYFCLLEMFCVKTKYHTRMIRACVDMCVDFSFSDYKSNTYSLENIRKTQKCQSQK